MMKRITFCVLLTMGMSVYGQEYVEYSYGGEEKHTTSGRSRPTRIS